MERQIPAERLAYCQAYPSFWPVTVINSKFLTLAPCGLVVRIHHQHTGTLFGCRVSMSHSDCNDIKRGLHVFLISLAHW
jgi:hypothetical protein